MSYNPATDLIGLLRRTSGGMRAVRMPGLDYLIAGLARAGMFLLWTGQTAPTTNLAVTVWLLPYSPSWTAEGAVYLYNSITLKYEPATPALWAALFSASGRFAHFQAVTVAAAAIEVTVTLCAVERNNPVHTALTLPSVLTRSAVPMQVTDWSTNVVKHEIQLLPAAGETIARRGTFSIFSTPDQLAGITLHPSPDLNAWVIAP